MAKAAMGAWVKYCGHDGCFLADILAVGNVNIVVSSNPVLPEKLDRKRKATHHMRDMPTLDDMGLLESVQGHLRGAGETGDRAMNHLSNGAPAVGSPGSLMRLIAAYEYELEKKCAAMAYQRSGIPTTVRTMLRAAFHGRANIGPCFAAAAKACEIKPTAKAIKAYLVRAGYDPRKWY
jgi:hypothetical protein